MTAPPPAPVVAGPWAGLSPRGRRTHSWDPAEESDWFDEPVALLELAQARRPGLARFVARRAAAMAVLLAVVCGLGLLVVPLARRDPATLVAIALVIWVGWTATWLWLGRHQTLYAGAERLGDGESTAAVVGLYDLAEITLEGTGAATRLRLTGANGTRLRLPIGLLEANPALWRLVHAGLHHSAARGGRVDPDTRARLHLPDPRPGWPR